MTNIWTQGNEEMRQTMLSILDDTKRRLMAGELCALVLIPVAESESVRLNGVIVGRPQQVTFELERAKLFVIRSHDEQLEKQQTKMLDLLRSSPVRGQA